MKTHIFYFSSTGNSLMIARSLAKEFGETSIFSIPRIINEQPDVSANRIGLIFPMYYGGVPNIVKRFIKKIPPAQGKYIFAITSGRDTDSPVGALVVTKKLLKRQGLSLFGGFYLQMVSNFIPMFDALPGEEQKRRFAKARIRIQEIARIIGANQQQIEKNSFLMNWLVSTVLNRAFAARIPNSDKNFWVDERCTGCGTCEKVCPVQNIRWEGGKPSWLHHCELCLGCLQWCPETAIQYGKKTAARTRYRNPEVTIKDFLYK